MAALRERVAGPGQDRFLSQEVEATVEFVRSGAAVDAANSALAQPLQSVSAER